MWIESYLRRRPCKAWALGAGEFRTQFRIQSSEFRMMTGDGWKHKT